VRDSCNFLRDLLSRKRVGAPRTAFRERHDNRSQTSKTSLPVAWPRRACTAARQDARCGFAFPSAINGDGMLLPAPSDGISYDDITLALRRRSNSRRDLCFNDAIHHLTCNNSRQRAQKRTISGKCPRHHPHSAQQSHHGSQPPAKSIRHRLSPSPTVPHKQHFIELQFLYTQLRKSSQELFLRRRWLAAAAYLRPGLVAGCASCRDRLKIGCGACISHRSTTKLYTSINSAALRRFIPGV
jgi:hypothetical protein